MRASRRWGLPTWDKPAAACLSSRVAYGIEVTPHRLARVERAEAGVRAALGAAGLEARDLRVRDLGERATSRSTPHCSRARWSMTPYAARVLDAVLAAGFDAAELDPRGFRSGSLNEALADGLSRNGLAGRWTRRLEFPAAAATVAVVVARRRGQAVPSGKVKWFDADKGFGFLSQDERSRRLRALRRAARRDDDAQERHPRRVRHRPGPSRRPGPPGPGGRRTGVGLAQQAHARSARTPS